jgi:ATP-binding cassette subfamily C protein
VQPDIQKTIVTEQPTPGGIAATDERARDLERLQARKNQDAELMDEAMMRFSRLFDAGATDRSVRSADPLLAAMAHICTFLNLPFSPPKIDFSAEMTPEDQLQEVARHVGIRIRKVALADGWWQRDCGPLIGFTHDDGVPVALICGAEGRYLAHTSDGKTVNVTAAFAEQMRYFASMLYRSFPDTPVTGKTLLRFGLSGVESDLTMLVVMGFVGSLLSLAVPIVTGVVFDAVIPQAQRNQLWLLCVALSLCAVAGVVFEFTKRIALFRVESRMDQHIQGAVWDRLLKLPPAFFRQYSSGDLADRSLGISAIRQTFSDSITDSLLAAIFSVTSLALLFYYSFQLALVAIGLALVAVTCSTALGLLQIHFQKRLAAQRGELSGKVLDIVSCIAKFKIAGAEDRAFSRWAGAFFVQKETILKARMTANVVQVFSEMFPLVASIVIFSMIISSKSLTLSVGGFLAFNAAFTQFVGTLMSLSQSLIAISSAIPSYKRCQPIIEALPERDSAKEHPGIIKGDIEVSGVSFRYSETAPMVLNDISFRIMPGEFVAVVGTSGGGKSTLTRLLLGFEKPSSGCVFYDGKDLDRLDVNQVRRQIGVVLQNGKLIAGDILSNIVGSLNLTIDHAWEAARCAGLEEDIQAMPMGMHTFLSEGGGNLSGGQRQRLLIARALVNKPSILLFDEATSALDNRTQAIVNESLEALQVSRIVIAHRLSTVQKADRILVLDKGKLVESGTYEELMQQGEIFAELARRQVA